MIPNDEDPAGYRREILIQNITVFCIENPSDGKAIFGNVVLATAAKYIAFFI
jgi:hypothetical protein